MNFEMELEQPSVTNVGGGQMVTKADEILARLFRDLIERPGYKAKRSMTIKITVTPDKDADGTDDMPNLPDIHWEIAMAVPGWRGRSTKAYVDGDMVYVNPADAVNPLQQTLPDPQPENVTPIGQTEQGE